MDTYSPLVEQILQVPVLADKISSWASEADTLNLVTSDWKKQLEHSLLYRTFQKKAKNLFNAPKKTLNDFRVQTLSTFSIPTQVIIVGVCNVYKPFPGSNSNKQPFAVTVQESSALNMLGLAWTSDVDPDKVQLSGTTKLNFQPCSFCCQHCSSASEEMIAKGLKLSLDTSQPCILDMEVFNGKELANSFAPQVKSYFPGNFIAIMNVELNVRYFYPCKDGSKKDWVRIGGKALSMVAFPESNLMPQRTKLSLGNLPMLAQMQQAPKPSEDMQEEPSTSESRSGNKRRLDSYEEDEDDVIDIKKKTARRLDSFSDECEVVEESISFN